MTVPFISTGDLGAFLGRDVTGDPLAIIAIDSSCEIVRSYIGNNLNLTEETVLLDGPGTDALFLPLTPVWGVSEVILDDETLVTTEYSFDSETGILYRPIGSTWTLGRRNVSVTYQHGYDVVETVEDPTDVPRVPSDIRRVALTLAQRMFVSSGSIIGIKQSEQISDIGYSYTLFPQMAGVAGAAGLNADEMALLDAYVMPVAG